MEKAVLMWRQCRNWGYFHPVDGSAPGICVSRLAWNCKCNCWIKTALGGTTAAFRKGAKHSAQQQVKLLEQLNESGKPLPPPEDAGVCISQHETSSSGGSGVGHRPRFLWLLCLPLLLHPAWSQSCSGYKEWGDVLWPFGKFLLCLASRPQLEISRLLFYKTSSSAY